MPILFPLNSPKIKLPLKSLPISLFSKYEVLLGSPKVLFSK
jgi:hypothetical protein